MMGNTETSQHSPDSAAIFACALSLWRECMRRSRSGQRVNLIECYNGGDEFMRVVMRAGTKFEEWACAHIQFEALDECWPYLLKDRFGEACVALKDVTSLAEFGEKDCVSVALRLRLPIKLGKMHPSPVDVSASNPITESEFRQFRIQTIREFCDGEIETFSAADDPFDDNFSAPFFGLYGVCHDGFLEHISDFNSYSSAVSMARKLAPGIQFPDEPFSL
jgi:hypothetical protein